jgi:two-component system, LytTR family, sensor kinase
MAEPRATSWNRRLLLGLWLAASLMSLVPTALQYLTEGQPVPWGRMTSEAVGWLLWIVFFPVVLWGERRFPLDRSNWGRSLAAHVAIGSAVSVAYALLVLVKSELVLAIGTGDYAPYIWQQASGFVLGGFYIYFLVYWMILALFMATGYYRRLRLREVEVERLAADLSRAQLRMLQLQLDPHFLFNALNAVAALVHIDADRAESVVGLLGDFLRRSLQNAHRQEVQLREEVDFLELYLAIERTRFGSQLLVEIAVPPELGDDWVPQLILQPLVENSIRHGMRSTRALQVSVEARALDASMLELRIRDDGRGLESGAPPEEGVGVSNTKARLLQLYGGRQSFTLRQRPQGGVEVVVTLPRRGNQEAAARPSRNLGTGTLIVDGGP